MQAEFKPKLYNMNLAGMMVGNGCTNWDVDTSPSLPETLFNFQIIPRRILDTYQENNCLFYGDATYNPDVTNSPLCVKTEA